MDTLFKYHNTWGHYIGGYYKTTEKFINEAKTKGITRRAPGHVIKNMQFGDKVILFRYEKKGVVYAFGEMIVETITFEDGIASDIGKQLIEDGKAIFHEGGGMVSRECGSFFVIGTIELQDVTLPEIMEMAEKAAKEKGVDFFCMIGGSLVKVYEQPVFLNPAPAFTRSFIRFNENPTFTYEQTEDKATVISIRGYQKG